MGLKAYNVHFSEWQLAELERLAEEGLYSSVAEAIRIAVRDLLARDLKARKRLNSLLGDIPAIDEETPICSLTSQIPVDEI
ncbi:MAG: ribbon-helix-helix domain-containing protein [Thermoproteota archaeon]